MRLLNFHTTGNEARPELVEDGHALVAQLSHILVFEPGDVIRAGTPDGIGAKQHPLAFLKEGGLV